MELIVGKHIINKPFEHGSLGSYSIAMTSGTIAAALAAAAVLFAFRWTDTTRFAIVHRLRARFQPLTPFTAATLTDFGFDAFVARTYGAVHTGGTAATLTTNSMKKRVNMGTTLAADIRMATTAALGGAAGLTQDANAFAQSLGLNQRVNPAAATEETRIMEPTLEFRPAVADGEHPLMLGSSEGIVIRNRTVWPAAGTGILQVEMAWTEVAAF